MDSFLVPKSFSRTKPFSSSCLTQSPPLLESFPTHSRLQNSSLALKSQRLYCYAAHQHLAHTSPLMLEDRWCNVLSPCISHLDVSMTGCEIGAAWMTPEAPGVPGIPQINRKTLLRIQQLQKFNSFQKSCLPLIFISSKPVVEIPNVALFEIAHCLSYYLDPILVFRKKCKASHAGIWHLFICD